MTLLITNLKPSTYHRTALVSFSDQTVYVLPLDWCVSQKLRLGDEVTDEQVANIKHQASFFKLREYALRQIAITPKTEKTLRLKMSQFCQKHKMAMPKTTEQILIEIKQKGLLDDQKYSEYYLRKYPKKAPKLLKYELLQQGIAPDILENVLSHNPLNTSTIIQQLLAKKKVTPQLLAESKEKNRILSMILRKGFSIGEAKSAIDDYLKLRYNKLS